MEKTLRSLTKLPSKMGKVADVVNNIIDHIKYGSGSGGETINDFEFALPLIKDDTDKIIQIDKNGDYTKVLSNIIIYQNGEITDPASMVESSTGKFGFESKPYENAWSWVRNHSHIYVGKWNNEENILDLRQLDDNDSRKFKDGSDARNYISDSNNEGYNVFMKLPKFWYKDELNEDGNLIFTISNYFVEGYNEWNDNNLIGVYESYVDTTLNVPLVRSISQQDSIGNINWTNYKIYARNNNIDKSLEEGKGFSLVTFQQHSIMAYLFYGYYGTIDSQSICGYGTDNYEKPTGLTDNLGMKDTDTINGNGSTDSQDNWKNIRFWGLENWWGNKWEWIDNLQMQNDEGLCGILDLDGNVIDTYQFDTDKALDGVIKNMKGDGKGYAFFDSLDDDEYDYSQNYTDYGGFGDSGHVAGRSDGFAGSSGGVGYLSVDYVAGGYDVNGCSRLAYCGAIRII